MASAQQECQLLEKYQELKFKHNKLVEGCMLDSSSSPSPSPDDTSRPRSSSAASRRRGSGASSSSSFSTLGFSHGNIATLADTSNEIKATLTRLLSGSGAKQDEAFRYWIESKLMEAEMELKQEKRELRRRSIDESALEFWSGVKKM